MGNEPVDKVSEFYNWIVKQKRRDDPVGDLASDILRDRSFPKEKKSHDSLKTYLSFKGACQEALWAFDEAWLEFSKKSKSRNGVTPKVRWAIFERDGYACCVCGHGRSDGVKLEVDHKKPVSKGGSSLKENLWTLCFDCNRGKGTSDLKRE